MGLLSDGRRGHPVRCREQAVALCSLHSYTLNWTVTVATHCSLETRRPEFVGRENSNFLPQYAPCRPLATAPPGAPHVGPGAHASHLAFPPRAFIRYSLGPERASFPFAEPNPRPR